MEDTDDAEGTMLHDISDQCLHISPIEFCIVYHMNHAPKNDPGTPRASMLLSLPCKQYAGIAYQVTLPTGADYG